MKSLDIQVLDGHAGDEVLWHVEQVSFGLCGGFELSKHEDVDLVFVVFKKVLLRNDERLLLVWLTLSQFVSNQLAVVLSGAGLPEDGFHGWVDSFTKEQKWLSILVDFVKRSGYSILIVRWVNIGIYWLRFPSQIFMNEILLFVCCFLQFRFALLLDSLIIKSYINICFNLFFRLFLLNQQSQLESIIEVLT